MNKLFLLLILCSCTHYKISQTKNSPPECKESVFFFLPELEYPTLEECQQSEKFKTVYEPTRLMKIEKFMRKNPEYSYLTKYAVERIAMTGMPEELVYITFGKPTNVVINTEEFGVYKKQLDYPNGQIFLHNGFLKGLITPEMKK